MHIYKNGLYMLLGLFIGAFALTAYAQEMNEVLPEPRADFSLMLNIDESKLSQKPAKYLLNGASGWSVADSIYFNDSETCVYTDRNLILCGTFSVKPL